MKKKLFIVILIIAVVCITVIANTTKNNNVLDFINATYSPRQFSDKPISDEVIHAILVAGHKAPSAGNQQPWLFTVVRNKSLIDEIMPNVDNNNVLIVVSGPINPQRGFSVDFDTALATQNMFLAAHAQGLGARMYLMPVRAVNENFKEKLSIPEDYRATIILKIGYIADGVDATTAATPRQPLENKVRYIID